MKKYDVWVCYTTFVSVTVKAADAQSAGEIAKNKVDAMSDEDYKKEIAEHLNYDETRVFGENGEEEF